MVSEIDVMDAIAFANGAEAEVNAGLVELIKDAFTIRIQLLSGSDDSVFYWPFTCKPGANH